MKSQVAVLPGSSARVWDRLGDFVELTKPRIAILVLFTVLAGGVIAGGASVDPWILANAVLGTALIASGASVLNQLSERDSDARMDRTAARPLPTGRVAPWEAAVLGYAAAVVGSVYLVLLVHWLAAAIALASFVLYVFAYTPLKRITSLNTVVGAVPGALPPLVGWAAVRGSLDIEALWLFLLLFFWQFPHFFAIAWIYRDDYSKAGIRMLPTTPLGLLTTAWQIASFCLLLIPVALAPVVMGSAGQILTIGALVLGAQFLGFALAFLFDQSHGRARMVLFSSLVYLPVMLALWMLDAARFGS